MQPGTCYRARAVQGQTAQPGLLKQALHRPQGQGVQGQLLEQLWAVLLPEVALR